MAELPATEKQLEYAKTLGIQFQPGISKSEISKLIDAAVAKRDEERFQQIEKREGEVFDGIKEDLLAGIEKKEMVDELGRRGDGAILITFNSEVPDFDHLTGVNFSVNSSANLTSDEVCKVLFALGACALGKLKGE